MKKIFVLFAAICLLAGCLPDENLPEEEPCPYPEEEEPEVMLRLSVEEWVYTDDVDYTFEILEGNGGYTVEVSGEEDKDARATIVGTVVTVNLLRQWASVTVTDRKGQSAFVGITSTAESLGPQGYGVFMEVDSTYTMHDITFGAGGYSLEKKKGNSAKAELIEGDRIRVTGLRPGTTRYKIIDRRGTTAPLDVSVFALYHLTADRITINSVNEQTTFVILSRGAGGWTFAEEPSHRCIKAAWLTARADPEGKYDVLQIDTSEEGRGTAVIQLKDLAGNFAFITVRVRRDTIFSFAGA